MSQDSTSSIPPVAQSGTSPVQDLPDHVYLVSYPKIVFLYPTVLTSLFCAIVMWAKGDIPANEAAAWQAKQSPIVMKAAVSPQEPQVPAADSSSPVAAAPTATAGTNTTQLATTAFVTAATPAASTTVSGFQSVIVKWS